MHDVWYDLAVLELSELSDPGREKLIEAERAQATPEPAAEESLEVASA
ncbi:MAG TPA: hypothetical protein VL086_01875 [Candidatus Nitrosotalea sp.]|nr:hypothetical protein [Candidatus Nitrosotalea sp.]